MVRARGGQPITQQRLNDILTDMRRIHPRPQVHVLVLGDNNFRKMEYDPVQVLGWLQNFLNEARTIEKSHVSVCTLLPSIENKAVCDETFLQWDQSLKVILDTEFEIINIQKLFRKRNMDIREELYGDDGVHLNHRGADILAKKIFDSIRRLPHEFFE